MYNKPLGLSLLLVHVSYHSLGSVFKQRIMMGVYLPVILSTLTLLVSYPLDRQVDKFVKTLPMNSLFRCADTAVHGLIAALVWVTACIISFRRGYDLQLFQLNSSSHAREQDCEHDPNAGTSTPPVENSFHCIKIGLLPFKLLEVCTAFIIGGPIIDADHFIKARSLSIEDAILSPGRGFLHWTSLTLILSGLFTITGLIMTSNFCIRLGALIFICTFSHQIRDATHRGLSFYPLPSTPSCPYYLYVLITVLMPYVVSLLLTFVRLKEDQRYQSVRVV